MELVTIDKTNIELLQEMICNLGTAAASFRYFNTRPVEIIADHLHTVMVLENNKAVGYGHLDLEAGIVWLGICVLPSFQNKGIGKRIMDALIRQAKVIGINEIQLTVDNDNGTAVKLYEYFGFKKNDYCGDYSTYLLTIQ